MKNKIIIKGARQHNLKGIDVEIPRNKFTVITGLSGSGKSSLAFDTLYAEGQRRYVESLSAYARQFLDRLQKPDVEHIEGLSPAIAIEQRSSGSNPRSTVATTTEIYDYLRLLYAHVGTPHCPKCNDELSAQTAENICEQMMNIPDGLKFIILSPYIRGKKGEHREVFEQIRKDGFIRARVDGEIISLDAQVANLEKNKKHTIEAVVDRLKAGKTDVSRMTDSIELALRHSDGEITLLVENKEDDKVDWDEELISEKLACPKCNISFPDFKPRDFSFNSPYGACPTCHGLGNLLIMDPKLVVEKPECSLNKGAIPNWKRGPRRVIIYYNHLLRCLAEHYVAPEMLTTPFEKLSKEYKDIILNGSGDEDINFSYNRGRRKFNVTKPFEGVLANLERRYHDTETDSVRDRLRKCMVRKICPSCNGARLQKKSLAVTVNDMPINKFNALAIDKAYEFISNLHLSQEKKHIASEIVREISNRLKFLLDVGLSYLSLDRESGTLSGGEAQRIRLATQLGCGLVGVLYILDEPSIGLHQRDNDKLLRTIMNLRDLGNSVIVVEHDIDTILKADFVLDLGPGAGVHGGNIIAQGTPKQIMKSKKSLTGQYLNGEVSIEVPKERSKGTGEFLKIKSASHNNLKNVNVKIPLGTFCCITGVSGSGKSSLVNGVLKPAIQKHLGLKTDECGEYKKIEGLEHISKIINIDQSPIGRTPRSNPATYTDAFSTIRKIFSELPASKIRGYKPGRFSFNVKGGRCEVCKGDGIKKIEMQFLSDVFVTCSTCNGQRFNNETLNIKFKKKNIADILDMTVSEGTEFFESIPTIYRRLKMLLDVGLGYIRLGQAATTLSGGEAQRVKLATELAKIPKGHTLYILDEPTTGLHIADINKLLDVLKLLKEKNNTVLVIEHNLDVIKTADHIIDLGPEGGAQGGEIIAQGTPEKVAKIKKSYTGQYLKKILLK